MRKARALAIEHAIERAADASIEATRLLIVYGCAIALLMAGRVLPF